jgi:hypothetical protein
MSKNKDQSVTWHFLAGLLITEAGFWLLAFGELNLPGTWMHHLSYGGVFLLCLGMIVLSWRKLPRSKNRHQDPGPSPTAVAVREKFLGEIDLNGYLLEAYEQEVDGQGKQFRLRAFPSIDSEHEARYVRYLIHEGFIDQRWPRVNNKIKEEAGWAFLF